MQTLHEVEQSSALPCPKDCGLMVGCPKGKKSQRYPRKTIKDRAKKTSEVGKSLSSFATGKLQKKKKKKRENIERKREAGNDR